MKNKEKYGLGKRYQEVEITQETLYDFLKSVELNHFTFYVFLKEPSSLLICGLVYESYYNEVETFKEFLMKYKKEDVWKVFKFSSKICNCYAYRIILKKE